MELCSILCASLDRWVVWGRTDTCICMAESLHCLPEITSTLLMSYTTTKLFLMLKNKNEKKSYEV